MCIYGNMKDITKSLRILEYILTPCLGDHILPFVVRGIRIRRASSLCDKHMKIKRSIILNFLKCRV